MILIMDVAKISEKQNIKFCQLILTKAFYSKTEKCGLGSLYL